MKKSVTFLLTTAILLSIFSPLSVFASYNDSVEIDSDVAYVVCLDNDEVIFDKNYDKQHAPASLTKIMTALVAIEECDDLTKQITVSQNVINTIAGTDSSNAGLKAGEVLTMENLLYCLMVESANDAAIAIAENIASTEKKFVKLMNQKAKELGCKNTNFKNTHGLDEEGHYTTAEDLYLITKEALKHPIFEKIVNTTEYNLPKTNMSEARKVYSSNLMLNAAYDDYYLSYLQGIKTGTTDNAGRCIVTKSVNDGYSYLAIVMGGSFEDIDADGVEENGAFIDCKAILKWIYNNIQYKLIAEADQTICVSEVKYSWKTDFVRIVPAEESYALVPNSLDTSSVYIELDEEISGPLKAPFKKGEIIGTATVYYGGDAIATIDVSPAETARYSFILHMTTLIKAAWGSVLGKILIFLLILLIIATFILKRLIKMKIVDISEIKAQRRLRKHLK